MHKQAKAGKGKQDRTKQRPFLHTPMDALMTSFQEFFWARELFRAVTARYTSEVARYTHKHRGQARQGLSPPQYTRPNMHHTTENRHQAVLHGASDGYSEKNQAAQH